MNHDITRLKVNNTITTEQAQDVIDTYNEGYNEAKRSANNRKFTLDIQQAWGRLAKSDQHLLQTLRDQYFAVNDDITLKIIVYYERIVKYKPKVFKLNIKDIL